MDPESDQEPDVIPLRESSVGVVGGPATVLPPEGYTCLPPSFHTQQVNTAPPACCITLSMTSPASQAVMALVISTVSQSVSQSHRQVGRQVDRQAGRQAVKVIHSFIHSFIQSVI